ncbi:hypothetical protein D0T08_11830 [Emticicia sp. C21]|nr:hypothetical protein D0T08_11830 [Emticicia sp. C21]
MNDFFTGIRSIWAFFQPF